MVALRRTVQWLSFLLFCFLIITTRASFEDGYFRVQSPISPYLYFTTNPLTYVAATAASRTIPAVNYVPLLVLVGLVLIFGRFYCGWLCPLGALIDGAATVMKPPKRPKPSQWIPSPNLKIYILLAIMITALFGVNIVGFFDPITIAFKSLSLAVNPYLEWLSGAALGPLWQVPVVNQVSEPVYGFLKTHYFTPVVPRFEWSLLFLGILVGIFALSMIRRRFWCRYLCPLGAFHALLGRFAIWRRRVDDRCARCTLCARDCRTQAIDHHAFEKYDTRECIVCQDCAKICPKDAIAFSILKPTPTAQVKAQPLSVSRRGLLGALGASLVALPFLRATAHSRAARTGLLRPPGAAEEKEFLARCIRCGECMRVCPQNALQPALLQFGAEEMWSPVFTSRIGYCEFNCTLCMQVCPTGALEVLSVPAKQNFRIGTAYFDRNRCIPYNENTGCAVCEEVCPTPTKSIHMREEERLDDNGAKRIIKVPFILEQYCIGCGICENKCPVEGAAAILVAARYETRHGGLAVGGGFIDGGETGGELGEPPSGESSSDNPYGKPSSDDPYGSSSGSTDSGYELGDAPTSSTTSTQSTSSTASTTSTEQNP